MDTADLDVRPRLLPALLRHVSCPEACMRELFFADYKFLFDDIEDVTSVVANSSSTMNIRSLAFGKNDSLSGYSDTEGCVAYFAESILRRCASKLESFAWNTELWSGNYPGDETDIEFPFAFRAGPIAFNALRKFWSYCFESVQPSVLECFLAAPLLESFAPSYVICAIMLANNLPERYPLPHLRTFAVPSLKGYLDPIYSPDYIDMSLRLADRYSPRIEELFIYPEGDFRMDSTQVDPTVGYLVSHFSLANYSNLRYLCFSWVLDPELEILRAIGSNLVTLEELSFGVQPEDDSSGVDSVREYFPSHQDIITAISPLTKLERLAVFGDEYIAHWAGNHWAWHRFFKENVWFHQGRSHTFRQMGENPGEGQDWSEAVRGHTRPGDKVPDVVIMKYTREDEDPRTVAIEVAVKYAEALPSLEEFIIGRHLVEITGRESE